MRYLGPEWFAAAQAAIENDDQLRELTEELDLTIEQTVTVAEGPAESGPSSRLIQWHVSLHHGSVRLHLGPAAQADLRFRAPYDVAAAIAQGELAAPVAFVRGELTIGGDLRLLIAHQQTLATLDDVLRHVRRATTFA